MITFTASLPIPAALLAIPAAIGGHLALMRRFEIVHARMPIVAPLTEHRETLLKHHETHKTS